MPCSVNSPALRRRMVISGAMFDSGFRGRWPLGGQRGVVRLGRLHPARRDGPDMRRLVNFVPSRPEESVWSGGDEDQECAQCRMATSAS